MLHITIKNGERTGTAEVPSEFGPALRSALIEIRNEVGARSPMPQLHLDALREFNASRRQLTVQPVQ